jgi:simple sugar transport system ATP-binding protein
VLSPIEVGELYRTLRKLADGGATIAVVTHRLDEVARFADEVTAMRRGELVHHEQVPSSARGAPAAFVARLARAVMGGDPPPITQRAPVPGDAPVALELREIHVGTGGGKGVRGVDLEVAAGEIVGIAGVEGNGQNELVRALGGLDPLERGSIMLAGEPLFAPAPEPQVVRVRRAKRRGLVVIYDDRHRDELVLGATVADNLVLGDLGADESATMRRRLKRFAIEPADPTLFAAALSGGNQQKLVMARALDRKMSALVVAQPTRGVDVGTARIIHEAIAEAARAGAAVLVVSADLNELRALAHRIVVMLKGAITAELAPSASDEAIGRAMLGVDGEVAA